MVLQYSRCYYAVVVDLSGVKLSFWEIINLGWLRHTACGLLACGASIPARVVLLSSSCGLTAC